MDRRGLLRSLIAAVLGAAVALTSAQLAMAQSCRPADSLSSRTTSLLKDYVTATDSVTVRVAKSLGISGTSANKVSYNTSSSICSAAVTALNSKSGTPSRARSVYVWVVGTNYAVEDPADEESGFYRAVLLFTSKWVFKSAWAPN
jgi:hypothetical protein